MDHRRFWFFSATGIGGSKMIYRSIWLIWNLPGQLIKQATTPIFHFLKSPNWGKGCRQPMPPKIIRRYGSYTDGSTDFLPKPIPLFWLRVESVCWPRGFADGKNASFLPSCLLGRMSCSQKVCRRCRTEGRKFFLLYSCKGWPVPD